MLPLIVTLLPILLGVVVYSKLPDIIAVHWSTLNEPDGWVSKNMAVFGLPALMALLQFILCILSDTMDKEGKPKLEKIAIWVIPIVTLVFYSITLYIALGNSLDVSLPATLVMGVLFIVFGNYLPKIPQEQNRKRLARIQSPERYRKAMKQSGIAMFVSGILILSSLFFNRTVSNVMVGVIMIILCAFIIINQMVALGKGKGRYEDGDA